MITVSPAATQRIVALKKQKNNPDLMLRITVTAGGCSGFDCNFSLDSNKSPDDICFDFADVAVVTDESSLSLIENSVVDYKSDLIGSSFVLKNPNAKSTCGCGSSFAI